MVDEATDRTRQDEVEEHLRNTRAKETAAWHYDGAHHHPVNSSERLIDFGRTTSCTIIREPKFLAAEIISPTINHVKHADIVL